MIDNDKFMERKRKFQAYKLFHTNLQFTIKENDNDNIQVGDILTLMPPLDSKIINGKIVKVKIIEIINNIINCNPMVVEINGKEYTNDVIEGVGGG